jgi:hypothetical protein
VEQSVQRLEQLNLKARTIGFKGWNNLFFMASSFFSFVMARPPVLELRSMNGELRWTGEEDDDLWANCLTGAWACGEQPRRPSCAGHGAGPTAKLYWISFPST